MRTGSVVVMSVVAVDSRMFLVLAAMYASVVVGGGGYKGWVVVLADGKDIQPGFVCLDSHFYGCLDAIVLGGHVVVGGVLSEVANAEESKLHGVFPFLGVVQFMALTLALITFFVK